MNNKSLAILTKLIGDISSFDNIFIVDDRGNEVWSNDIPEKVCRKCRIFPIHAPAYNIMLGPSLDWKVTTHSINNQRAKDEYLYTLTEFIKRSCEVMVKLNNNTL